MKNIIISTFLFLVSNLVFGQTFKGIIKDNNNTPIAFANVIVKQNNQMITGTITDEEGKFEITVTKKKPFQIEISFINYESWHKEVTAISNTDFGVIILKEIKNELDEVIITAKKPTIKRKVDRLVFNIENSIVSSGGDAMDVLKKTPGVRVGDNAISLIGKSSVRILINDRISPLTGEDLTNYLQSLNSNDITKIEVITNPPSKYEAAGNSGLINIVLKKAKKNYFGGNVRSTYRQATYASAILGGGITYQKNKLSLFTNINASNGSVEVNETNKIFYPNQTWDTDSKVRYFTKSIAARAGIDYDINENTSFGFQYLGGTSKPDNNEITNTNLINNLRTIDSLLLTKAGVDKKNYYHSFNGHFKAELDTLGKSINVDVDYFIYDNKQTRNNTTETFQQGNLVQNPTNVFRNTSNQHIKSFTSGIDLEWPSKFANLEFGGKVSFIKNNSDVSAFNFQNNTFTINPNQSNVFEYQENTQAIYASVSKSLKKWDFKLGLRMEFTQTEGNSITLNQLNENNYNKLFPTAYVTYNPNDSHSLSLNYGKRINRPNYHELNPFRWYSNPFSYSEGNPFLQPSFIDNFELSHTFKNNLNTSFYVSFTEDGSDQITLTDSNTNIQATVRRNFLTQNVLGIYQSYTLKKVKWLESYLQYDVNYSKIKSNLPNTIQEQDGFNFYGAIDNSFYFNNSKTFLGEFNFWYSSPSVSGVDRIGQSYAADMGLKWLFLDKKLQVNFVLTDIFKTNRSVIKSIVNGIKQEYNNYYDNRQLRVSLTYKFGNSKLRSKRKSFSNEEERSRAN
ncbi:TonB-dependent receptor domain-containing protein [Tenacibaculum sp. 190524A02b]|uniref:TonB-dependent receptor domain-containing protein n=1 Tax=Tenacibaculum vairaonense TaxID=3137860 RepID=UPI0031FB4C9F